jgi:hypothetical protein
VCDPHAGGDKGKIGNFTITKTTDFGLSSLPIEPFQYSVDSLIL